MADHLREADTHRSRRAAVLPADSSENSACVLACMPSGSPVSGASLGMRRSGRAGADAGGTRGKRASTSYDSSGELSMGSSPAARKSSSHGHSHCANIWHWAGAGTCMRSSLLHVHGKAACLASRPHLCSYPGAMHTPSRMPVKQGAFLPRHLQTRHPGAPEERCRQHSRWCHPCPHGSLQWSGCAAGRSCMKAALMHRAPNSGS